LGECPFSCCIDDRKIFAGEQAGRVPLIGDWVAQFILGGTSIGRAALTRFFAIHVFIMPP
jgi:ubiquinol-cytochrome c reductase cytochrome b subunit